uniref:bifunctional glutamate--cysteine ligase GshA/glutathione synthetase GshB n=1 Tax=Eubacterium maltosivorans TaxID=2041044 RepID=UPI003A939CD2
FTSNELLTGDFGLEREGLRVTAAGKLAMTPHPAIFGNKLKNPYITTDFSESQVEVVTPAYDTVPKTYAVLEGLCDIVNNEIGDEYFWPQSMPCDIPEDGDIPIAVYEGEKDAEAAMAYRKGLIERYGGKKQLISGIHFNFSFTERFIDKLHAAVAPEKPRKDFKDGVYLKLVRNYLRYRWLVVYLLGCSSALHKSYIPECVSQMEPVGDDSYVLKTGPSFRNSICGYKNKIALFPSYRTVREYTADVQNFVDKGLISAPKELYTQIRMKAKGVDNILESLEEDGIKYLEIRTVDLNVFDKCGIAEKDLVFLHQFMLYLLVEEESDDADWQKEGLENEEKVAFFGLDPSLMIRQNGKEVSMTRWALEILEKMQKMDIELELGNGGVLKVMTDRVIHPEHTYAYRMAEIVEKEGYLKGMMRLAETYKKESHDTRYLLKGFDNYELSTQILIKEAITRGVPVEEIDPQDNFIGLGRGDKKTYVKQATKTELDNYITVLVMENKVVTKKIMAQKGIPVPDGEEFSSYDEAARRIGPYVGKKVVIKPKSTNYGLGICIFDQGGSEKDLLEAVEIAFEYDKTVIIEAFIPGQEYRFLVIGGEVAAVLKRVPANVTGDGVHTITQLVDVKNRHPFRGYGYTAPLKKIELDEQTELYLKQQELKFGDVLPDGKTVYLRGNSNISTGGDSIDMTDEMPNFFKRIAVEAAASVKAVFCGVDIIIEDYRDEKSPFGIIELNFNPSTDMHAYPYQGTERRTGEFILRALGLIEN